MSDHIALLDTQTPFQQAVAAAGGLHSLASKIGVKPQRAGNWYERGVPPEFCPGIERATGVRCETMRPELTWTRDTNGQITGYHVPVAA